MTPVLIPIINGTIEIPLTRGQVAIIDAVDYDLVADYKWFANPSGKTFYAMARKRVGRHGYKNGVIRFSERKVSMHEVIFGVKEGLEIDHIDRDGLNNRRSNLRHVTRQQQMCNTGPRKGKYKGVWRETRRISGKCWVAGITIPGGRQKYLGSFDTAEEAAAAFNEAAQQYYGQYAYLNAV